MGFDTRSDDRTADSLLYGHLPGDPKYSLYRDGLLSPVWEQSERLRTLLAQKGRPKGKDSADLAEAVRRQLTTFELYRQVLRLKGRKTEGLILFMILFPGEARDNTGIKDLNDKILGYRLNNRFIECRQKAIADLFWQGDRDLPPKFVTIGSDYKTAQVLGFGKTRKDFAEVLKKLDAKLVACLKPLLDEAEKEEEKKKKEDQDQKRLKAIKDLRRKLSEKGYRFDFLYGARVIDFAIKDPIEATFLMLTETLKGAGIARLMAKSDGGAKKGSRISGGLTPDPKDQDRRGKGYDHASFITVIKKAGVINKLIRSRYEYLIVYIDGVWAVAFYEYRRDVFMMNPDVLRDARKKAIEYPPRNKGYKSKGFVDAQKYLLESWLIAVNALDLVKDFLVPEFKNELPAYHAKALEAFSDVSDEARVVDWNRLDKVLTRDLRQGSTPIPVQGRASEFRFYANSSDKMAQIFLAMDIRDLGVQLALLYDWFIGSIEVHKPHGVELMMETIASSDFINRRKRATYDAVVATFRAYYAKTKTPDAERGAITAFGGRGDHLNLPRSFEDSLEVMMGGDEIFVAAHPLYSQFVCAIIADLRVAKFRDRPLDLRTGVAYSRAQKANDQKRANWVAHDQALGMATSALNILKPFERAHRRMERLIEKLEANPKKRKLAAPYTAKLEALGLMGLHVRYNHAIQQVLQSSDYAARVRKLTEKYAWDEPDPELVDSKCKEIDAKELELAVKKLQAEIEKDVGRDNFYIDPPPLVTSIPPAIKKILDWFLPPEKYPYDDPDKKEREERERRRREQEEQERQRTT